MSKSFVLVVTLLSLTTLACGGGSSTSSSCGSFTACGGSVVGTWKISNLCMGQADAGVSNGDASACSGTPTNVSATYGGTLTFASDGTYTVSLTTAGSASFTYSSSCLSSMGMTCTQIDSLLKSLGTSDAGVSGSCASASSGGCACSETLNSTMSPETGNYTTSGSTITMQSSTSTSTSTTADLSDYCVQGNTLMIRASSTTSGQSALLVATK